MIKISDKERTMTEEMCSFIQASPSCFHVCENGAQMLKENGFVQLQEWEKWEIVPGGKYFITRNDSALIAFCVPQKDPKAFQIIASHSDAPCFKIKANPEIFSQDSYTTLNVEPYGGLLMAPWFDRPLSVAGRIMADTENGIVTKLVDIDRNLVMLVSQAIHMNRDANHGIDYKPQKDLLPLFGSGDRDVLLVDILAEQLQIEKAQILDMDLYLYNRDDFSIWGADKEYFSSPKIDDLACVYSSIKAICHSENTENITVCAVLDNEEVGSGTKQGALSDFLANTLKRTMECLGKDREDYYRALAKGMMLSADNAQAAHPNHMAKADPVNRVYLNEGVVIKYSGNQKYCTDAIAAAAFKKICKNAGVKYQEFTNNSDVPGGSTLGNLSNQQASICSVDIGAPQLAMHSPYETAGVKDMDTLEQAMEAFYKTKIQILGNKIALS